MVRTKIYSSFDDIFNGVFSNYTSESKVNKTDDGYKLSITVPGLTKDDINIKTKEGVITITYDDDNEHDFIDNFTKSYQIPDDVKESEIKGEVKNGILVVIFPFNKKKKVEREIKIN